MCVTPKYITLVDDSGKVRHIFANCGKCYECQCSKRAQAVLRMTEEKKRHQSSFFITLTYEDENLVVLKGRRFKKKELKREQAKPRIFRRYDNFVLCKHHVTEFLKKLQHIAKLIQLKKHLYRYQFYKRAIYKKNKVTQKRQIYEWIIDIKPQLDALFRFWLTAEYGTLHRRPHYHAIIFSPYLFIKEDFEKIIQKCWRFGNVKVRDFHIKGVNYIAKHQVKSDRGSKYQQQNAPIFYISSKYKGGIGYNLLQNKELLRNYDLNIMRMQSGKFTSSFPRFIRNRLHPQKLTSDEWDNLERQSFSNFAKFCRGIGVVPPNFEIWRKNKDSPVFFITFYLDVLSKNCKLDAAKKREYFKQKYNKKLINSNNSLNNNNYEYF